MTFCSPLFVLFNDCLPVVLRAGSGEVAEMERLRRQIADMQVRVLLSPQKKFIKPKKNKLKK